MLPATLEWDDDEESEFEEGVVECVGNKRGPAEPAEMMQMVQKKQRNDPAAPATDPCGALKAARAWLSRIPQCLVRAEELKGRVHLFPEDGAVHDERCRSSPMCCIVRGTVSDAGVDANV